MNQTEFQFSLYPKQETALRSPARIVVYGGGLGGGKTYCAKTLALQAALNIPGIQVYIFRREYQQLLDNYLEGPDSIAQMIEPIKQAIGTVEKDNIRIVDKGVFFPHRSKINFRHCEHEKDVWKYKSVEMHFLILDQGEEFTELQIRVLFSRNRVSTTLPVPENEKCRYPRIFASVNPLGESIDYWRNNYYNVYERLRTSENPYPVWRMPKIEGRRTAQFIPALVHDNPAVNPEEYVESLQGLRNPNLIDALVNGKWNVPMGAFFPELDERIHRIESFEIPTWWTKYRTFDWGSGAPFAVLWIAVSDGSIAGIPEGALVFYREWYGASPFDKKKGLGMSNEQIALGIRDRSPKNETYKATITDSKPFQADGGNTIAGDFNKAGVPLLLGNVGPGSRIQGWQQVRGRLIQRKMFIFEELVDTWRTLTTLQTSENPAHKGEDCITTGEDHLPDAVSLACKATPLPKAEPKKLEPVAIEKPTFSQMLKYTNQQRRYEERRQ